MPRPKLLIPAYRLHKSTGRAVVDVNRQEIYLGKYGSPESHEAYSTLLEHLGAGRALKVARELFGETNAAEFGPLRLRSVREAMIANGWSRGSTNRQINGCGRSSAGE